LSDTAIRRPAKTTTKPHKNVAATKRKLGSMKLTSIPTPTRERISISESAGRKHGFVCLCWNLGVAALSHLDEMPGVSDILSGEGLEAATRSPILRRANRE
jgi:hypothetical protein